MPEPDKPIKIKDTRKTDAVTGKPVLPTNNLSHDASSDTMQRIITASKANGVDPYTALAVAHQETGLSSEGDNEGNPFHLLDNRADDSITAGVKTLKQKLDYAKKLGKTDEASQIQAFNGYGKVGANTEGQQKSMYGIDVTKQPIDMNKNPAYGKRIIDIRDNILKNNPEVVKMVEGQPTQSGGFSTNYTKGSGPPDVDGDPSKPQPPKNYAPLKPAERTAWNGFLDYLSKQGVAGSPELDKRDQSLGLSYMDKYRKLNPDFKLQPEDLPRVQYDSYLIRKGDSYSDMSPSQLSIVRQHLQPAYLNRTISDTDGWLGSLTSKQYYPQGKIVGTTNTDFGTDTEAYSKALLGQK